MPKSLIHASRAVTLLLGAIALFSCEEEVLLDFEVSKSTLVLSSSFFPDQPVMLQVSATRPRGTGRVAEVHDATALLYEGNELAEELTYVPSTESGRPGSYRTTRFKPQVGRQYTIHVAAPGFDPVTAISSIPEPVAIQSIEVRGLSRTDLADEAIIDYHLAVDYADPVHEVNYYDLRVSQMVVPFKVNNHGDTIRSQPYRKSVSTPAHQASHGEVVSLLLQDKGSAAAVELHLQCRLDPASELLGQVVAELRTVSPEYYFYQRSISRPDELPNSGLKDPVIRFNNVSSGIGVFAGYTSVQEGINMPGN